MAILVIFELDGVTEKEADEWGCLIIDACRLEPKVGMELVAVKDTSAFSQSDLRHIRFDAMDWGS